MTQTATKMDWIEAVLEAFGASVTIHILMKCDNKLILQVIWYFMNEPNILK